MTTAPLPRGRRWIALVAALSTGGILASCAGDTASTVTTSDDLSGAVIVVSDTRTPAAEPVLLTAERWTSRDDLLDEQQVTPVDVFVDPDDPTLLHIRFDAGDARCTGARVALDERPASVRVVLSLGTVPGSDGVCLAPERPVELTATL